MAIGHGLVGREREIRAVRELLEAVVSGPDALFIEGEQGIGKSTLWKFAVSEAIDRSYRVLRSRPAESEIPMAFSGLSDLLDHVMDEVLPELPPPQRRALETALLLEEPDQSDAGGKRRAVSLAVLGCLRALAVSSPVIVAVDDLQWLDEPTARVLAFVARRLEDEPIGLVLASRPGEPDGASAQVLKALPDPFTKRLPLGPLDRRALHHLLRDRCGSDLPGRTIQRVCAASAGNPLYATELARAVIEGGEGSGPDALPIPESVRELVARRLGSLPAQVRDVLLVTSALAHPTIELVGTAIDDPVGASAALARAVQRGVIDRTDDVRLFLEQKPTLDRPGVGGIRFAHPLFASVIYADAPAEKRRQVHRRLARAVSDPDEKAYHLALGSEAPDERTASLLERAAHRAKSRGAPEIAARLGDLACRLTPAERRSNIRRRMIKTAEYSFDAGDTSRARELIKDAVQLSSAGSERADALRRLGWLRYHEDSYEAAASLLRAAAREAGDNQILRLAVERDLAWAALRFGRTASAARHARAALSLAEVSNDPVALAESLTAVGLAEAALGRGVRADILKRAIELEEEADRVGVTQRPTRRAAVLLKSTDDLETARARYLQIHDRAVAKGNRGSLPLILAALSEIEFRRGRWSEAETYAEEGYEAAIRTAQEWSRARLLYAKALVHAHRGDVEAARVEAQEGMLLAERTEAAGLAIANQSILGFLELSLGDPVAAHDHLGPLVDLAAGMRLSEPEVIRFLPDEIDALVALSELDAAGHLLARLERRGRVLGPRWAGATAARCRGLVLAGAGQLPDALRVLVRAERMHRDLGQRFELGRTLLALGMVRRRAKMKRPAREALAESAAIFGELGATLWSRRTRAELARISGRRADPGGLTPTERRIAEMVGRGLTNREIAEMLFMKPKTVEHNLSRIYHKQGVHSRSGLVAKVLAEPSATTT